ncbi:DUF2797 domain-containing protein [Flavobacteriaceae bacterium]|jgi:hypothetical protein|nr:conserved hypothetical protein [Flavobacteria bacterium MS024-3C]KRO81068.1 MAG: hypothetical protein ABR91_05990 [Polaribacter sp. BACL8 MAG-120531-bin13]MBT4839218.1 DUF2797 domain-containing protein [Flavobacteriaceae bacterium]NQV62335.1 DUF2797 domain-containing protein [Cryomorphaceae bacterium]MBT7239454.1 DUF2797 domain-containing protein [Flavobacteriaceae bacterium]
MTYQGVLKKMQTELGAPIQYYLVFKEDFVHLNTLLGRVINIDFHGYECLNCHEDKPIFRQGFCKNCFFDTPQAGDWIMRPELSKAHLGIEDRDLAYEQKVQLQPHIVYLANSSHLKVGVTRGSQIPTRWIDQGAHEAIEILEAPNRYLAGITEVALKDHVADKTNWRKMLTGQTQDEDLATVRDQLKQYIPQEALPYFLDQSKEQHMDFPVSQYPEKVQSTNLGKTPSFSGMLSGIKGQYLIFEDQRVFNVRSHEGYIVKLSF